MRIPKFARQDIALHMERGISEDWEEGQGGREEGCVMLCGTAASFYMNLDMCGEITPCEFSGIRFVRLDNPLLNRKLSARQINTQFYKTALTKNCTTLGTEALAAPDNKPAEEGWIREGLGSCLEPALRCIPFEDMLPGSCLDIVKTAHSPLEYSWLIAM